VSAPDLEKHLRAQHCWPLHGPPAPVAALMPPADADAHERRAPESQAEAGAGGGSGNGGGGGGSGGGSSDSVGGVGGGGAAGGGAASSGGFAAAAFGGVAGLAAAGQRLSSRQQTMLLAQEVRAQQRRGTGTGVLMGGRGTVWRGLTGIAWHAVVGG
jgi:hypothetical protein